MSTENQSQNGEGHAVDAIATVQEQPIATQELQIIEDAGSSVSVFSNRSAFEHAQRVAIMLSNSELVPVTFQKKVQNCMIALEMAGRIGASPLMVMQNLYIVHGRPAWSSQFLIATLNSSGRFSSLRYEEDEKAGGRTRAYAKDLRSGEICYGAWVSMEMAQGEGWSTKTGSKWKTMPELMRRYRAAAFFTRQFAPEVSMGIPTTEEAVEIQSTTNIAPEVKKEQTETDRLLKLIAGAETLTELNAFRKHLKGNKEAEQAFLDKETELEGGNG